MSAIKFTFIILFISLLLWGCKSKHPLIEQMEASEKAHNERMRQTSVVFMSLKTMFPDEQVRALAKAAGRGQVKKIDALVAGGVDVNARGTSNATPLFWATRKRNAKGVRRLLELGANPNAFPDGGSAVVHYAARAEYRKYPILKAILEHGVDPNLAKRDGWSGRTPFFDIRSYVFRADDIRYLDLFMDYGADINVQDSSGITPVIHFAYSGRFDLVKELLKRGADYRLKTDLGNTLLDVIASDKVKYIPDSKQNKAKIDLKEWLEQQGISLPEN